MPPRQLKLCTKCKERKPLAEFYKQASTSDGLQVWCKGCFRERDREEYHKDPKKAHAKMKAWREAKKLADPEGWRRYKRDMALRGQYGISLVEWEALYDAQGGRCAICRDPFVQWAAEGQDLPHVDHDHQTGEVRGLLCRVCNIGLGHFRENPEIMLAAIQYLKDSSDREQPVEGAKKMLRLVEGGES